MNYIWPTTLNRPTPSTHNDAELRYIHCSVVEGEEKGKKTEAEKKERKREALDEL